MSKIGKEEIDGLLERGDRLYAPVEVAYILNLQQATVQEKCRTGQINAQKIGTQWRITAAELRRYLADGPLEVTNEGDKDE